jgi:hypothetical protein
MVYDIHLAASLLRASLSATRPGKEVRCLGS